MHWTARWQISVSPKQENSHEKFSFQSKGLHKVFQVAWWLTWKKYRARLFLQEELAILAGIQFFNQMAMIWRKFTLNTLKKTLWVVDALFTKRLLLQLVEIAARFWNVEMTGSKICDVIVRQAFLPESDFCGKNWSFLIDTNACQFVWYRFAEMLKEEKNKISHRRRALDKVKAHFHNYNLIPRAVDPASDSA